MTKTILIISLGCFMSACHTAPEKPDCAKFKEGKFTYHGKESGDTYIIERKDSTQVETNLRTGSITKLNIKWLNLCEYELKYLSRQSSPTDTLASLAKTLVLKTKIIQVGSDYCIFISKADGADKILTDTLKLVNSKNE